MPRYKNLEKQVDELVEQWKSMCHCLPDPTAFSSQDEMYAAIVARCPTHEAVCDFERAIVLDRGIWRPVAAPPGYPALLSSALDASHTGELEFDEPAELTDTLAEKVFAGRAIYESLAPAQRPVPAMFTHAMFKLLFNMPPVPPEIPAERIGEFLDAAAEYLRQQNLSHPD